jgi:uncharacterized protein with von Willebrand factor type A (vWA) domain
MQIQLWQLLVAFGVPTTATGVCVWFFKRSIEKQDKKREKEQAERDKKAEEREKNTEKLMLMIMQTSRATNVLAEATAKAVQRIPDAHCNGDMTEALRRAEEIQKEEQQFLIDQGVKHIFGE